MKFRSDRTRIAVVGSAYRMPGVGGGGFWEALIAGRDLVTSVSAERWGQETLLHPRKSEPGTSYTFAAGSVGDVSGFDAGFFGISPREAEQMDPQQRLLLEMAWEALESARIPPSSVRGNRYGVYVGLSSIDYAYRRADDLASIDATTMTGSTGSIAANRVSYVFDLRGPSMVIDTACSSSLVALHQACQSIRHGESDAALVGGISLHLHPYAFIGFSKASMLSPEGRCRVFDEKGDGYVRAEGGAVVLLKPLAQAIADGNPILGVIVETGVNNDGRKQGLTVPSHAAQAALLREVYERAGIGPEEIDYLEAHGTGTAVGDPIETRAIGEALGQHRPANRPLPVGSVKSHVGHLEAASGMAGLMKALGVLRHRRVPANLHFERANPHIDFAGLNLAPVTEPLDLHENRRIVVGVSGFGFGGTNAHAVLSSFETQSAREASTAPPSAPLMLSARSPSALRDAARRMARFLGEHPEIADYDIAYSAMVTRDIHPHRLSASGLDRAALAGTLEQFAETGSASAIVTGKLRPDASAPAFVFSGNGSQWVGMGLQLLDEEPVFREAVEEIDALLAGRSGRSLIADLRAAPVAGGLERTELAQPALFALQVGLVRLFEAHGIRPVAVCGHSVGEVAAAWASGALSLETAVRVIHERSARQAETRGRGRMAAIPLGESEMQTHLESLGLRERITIAALNAPASVTVAGDEGALALLGQALARRQIAFRLLPLDHAFHSPQMDCLRQGLLAGLGDLAGEAATVPFYSTVAGQALDGSELGARYWWRNVREPVRFDAAIRAMLEAGINTFVEVGPRPVLGAYLDEIARSAKAAVFIISTLSPKEAGGERIQTVGQQLELSGALHDLRRLFPVAAQTVDLPHYPWQRERFWHPTTPESTGLMTRRPVHPLLGYALAQESGHWETHLDTARFPALADHAVGGSVVFPAAGFVELALAAAAARRPDSAPATLAIEDFEILAPLVLDREHSKVVRLRIQAEDGRFTIASRDRAHEDDWRTHVVGRVVEESVPSTTEPLRLPDRAPDVAAEAHYALAHSLGLDYGPAFQSVTAAWSEGHELLGGLALPDCVVDEAATMFLHPAYLDGAFQLLMDLAAREHATSRHPDEKMPTFLPVRIDRVELIRPCGRVVAARVSPRDARHRSRRSLRADFALFDENGTAVALARGARFRAANIQRRATAGATWIKTCAVAMPRRTEGTALPLPALSEAASRVAARLHASARCASRRRYAEEVEPLLDVLCASFAERAVHELSAGAPFDLAEWQLDGWGGSQVEPLLHSLLQMLEEEGVLKKEQGRWEWTTTAGETRFPAPQDIWSSLIRDYPDHAPVITRTGTAGVRLLERLRSRIENAACVSQGDAAAFAWAHACTQPDAVALFEALEGLLGSAAAAQSASARLRVLQIVDSLPPPELGDALLPRVDADRCEHVLAAPSREALEAWQAKFARAAVLPGHVVDLESAGGPPVEAFGGRFDVILLSSGLSNAREPALRLSAARRLLFAGGMLLAIEQQPSRAQDLQFGASRRRTPAAWSAFVEQAGFVEVTTVLDTPETTTGPYVLLARASADPLEAIAETDQVKCRTWLLVEESDDYSAVLGAALGAELERAHQSVICVRPSARFTWDASQRLLSLDQSSTEQWERALAELQKAGIAPDAWVHLAGLSVEPAAERSDACAALPPEARAALLSAWLQACSRHSVRTDCWVIGAGTAAPLLPPGVAAAEREAAARGRIEARVRDAALWGLTRVAIQEYADRRVRWIDLADGLPSAGHAAQLARELLDPDAEDEIALTSTGRFALRLRADRERLASAPGHDGGEMPPARLDFAAPGPFRNLVWAADSCKRASPDRATGDPDELAAGEVEIDVRAAGLNFRDVMYAMGVLPDEAIEDGFCGPALGMEVAGVVRRTGPGVELASGDEVIAVAPAALAQRVKTREFAVARKPAEWSFAAAATVPTAFFTVYYALIELARLNAGERVLIHGAAGAVGVAAIQVARHVGAEVFATAGTEEKRDFVRLLGADRVFDSRSLTFADEILHATGGEGVDVVLNSLAGEAMRRNLRLLRPFGRMVELGKRDFYEDSRIGMRPFRNNVAYFGFDADQLMARRPDAARRVFRELMDLFTAGALHPLPFREFSATNIEAAFRHMQASRHLGKIVITFPTGFRARRAPVPWPATRLRPDATYLVTGGLSGFGLRTAWWLASRGAKHLALLGRRGGETPGAQEMLNQFAAAGVSVRILACDVADGADVCTAIASLRGELPALRGIVHAAAVIDDALIRDMTPAQLHAVLTPKVAGALNLHAATLDCALDFFLVYSSATTLFGNPGQGAYVAANMALETFAVERRARGLAATCISWGPIADVGYLARHERIRDALVGRIGGRALEADEALRALDAVLGSGASNMGLLELDWNVLGRSLPSGRAPKFSELARRAERRSSEAGPARDMRRWLQELPEGEFLPALTDVVRNEIAQILRIAPERIEAGASLFDLGMDSLMAVELAASIDGRLGVQLSALALSDAPTIERITVRLAPHLRPSEDVSAPAAPATDALTEQVLRMAAAHASEVSDRDATELSADLARDAAPRLVTARQRS